MSYNIIKKLAPKTLCFCSAIAMSGCSTISSYTSLPKLGRRPDVVKVDPYQPGEYGNSLYTNSGRSIVKETNERLRRRLPGSGHNTMELAVLPPINLVDGESAFAPRFGRSGSMGTSNKLNLMTEGTSIFIVSGTRNFCENERPGTPRYVLETEVTNYDQYISNDAVGPATTIEDGGYTGDYARGSEVTRDSFYLLGRIIPCSDGVRQTVENLKVEVQSTRQDDSILFFAKVLGFVVRKSHAKSPGLNNAVYIANDALLSTLLLKHVDKIAGTQPTYSPSKMQHIPSAPSPRSTWNPDEVISRGQRTYKQQTRYFPRAAARDFKCSFGYNNKCSLIFEMPRGGRLSDMEYYMQTAATNAGATHTNVGCSMKRRERVTCKINGDLTDLNPIAFRRELFGR